MLNLRLSLFVAVLLLSFMTSRAWSQEYGDPASRMVGAVTYSGSLSAAEVMVEEVQKIRAADIDASISFTVSVDAVKNEEVRVQSLDGLPIERPSPDSSIDEVKVQVPFHASDFADGNTFDYPSFSQHIDQMLRPLQVPSSSAKNQERSTEGSPVLNLPNCGGYALGTVITVRTESCLLGSITNQYTCLDNPTNGGRDWYLTSSQWFPPSDTDCFGGGV